MSKKAMTLSSNVFKWNKGSGVASMRALCLVKFPDCFYIKSARTGELKLFLYDAEKMEANEFFDGEAVVYFNPGGNVGVKLTA